MTTQSTGSAAASTHRAGVARITLRLHADWPPVLLPAAVLPQVALDVSVAPVPNCPPWFRGVIGRRGAVVPVFDVPASQGLPLSLLRQMRIVVLDPGPEALALLCTEVPGVSTVAGPAGVDLPPGLPQGLAPFLDPPLICGGQPLAVFDVRRWLASLAPSIAR